MARTFYVQQVGQAVLETSLPEPSLLCDPNMGLPHFFGSTKKDGWLESILISLVRQISYVWGWNCPEGSVMTSRSPSLKRLNLESTSVSLGVLTQGGSNIDETSFVISNFQDKACAL